MGLLNLSLSWPRESDASAAVIFALDCDHLLRGSLGHRFCWLYYLKVKSHRTVWLLLFGGRRRKTVAWESIWVVSFFCPRLGYFFVTNRPVDPLKFVELVLYLAQEEVHLFGVRCFHAVAVRNVLWLSRLFLKRGLAVKPATCVLLVRRVIIKDDFEFFPPIEVLQIRP